jgi:hypothetical protein
MTVAAQQLTSALQQQLAALEDDLRARVDALPGVRERWEHEHREALRRERTAASWQQWRDERVMQAAVAWLLATVFVRFCEDNDLVAPVWIAGPEARRQEALDAQLAYFREHPEDTDREWLQQAVAYLAKLPATAALVEEHSPLHLVSPSGDAAAALLTFWRERDEQGGLAHDLSDPSLTPRFLGDLYQELSAYARDTYALLQTPEFVEEFILARTLTPALAERPLDGFRLIDPTCGSGHFLLGAFDRLLDRWHDHAPGLETQARVQAALDAIHGVDINPFAVAIARFRLTVAALKECGLRRLEDAPAFRFHLAVGDSLLHGSVDELDYGPEHDLDAMLSGHAYSTEDIRALRQILQPGRYDVVVGNPPYITVKDKRLNQAYRDRYKTCKGTYAMTVPFMERFFQLAKEPVGDRPPGWVGQITSNSFMKREFGVRLIEKFLANRDLRLVADTSGAYIPGHGTPTVIIVGRNRSPVGSTVRSVLGIRGEPGRPDDPSRGIVWRSIVDNVDDPGHDDGWTSTADLGPEYFGKHPWSLTGGGAAQLRSRIEDQGSRVLGDVIMGRIGFASFPGADECFFAPESALRRDGVPDDLRRPVVAGDVVRDWLVREGNWALVPYSKEDAGLVSLDESACWARRLWRNRTVLEGVTGFGGVTRAEAEGAWWGWYRWVPQRYGTPLSLAFAEIATHNHFMLDRGGRVYKQTAPVIKLPGGTTENDHLSLLGVLNSSTACFQLKQKCHNKGRPGAEQAGADEPWEHRYVFNAANVAELPLPASIPLERGRLLDGLAQELGRQGPEAVCRVGVPTRERLETARAEYERARAQMIAEQEELDWEVYRLYRLVTEELTYGGDDLPGIGPSERAFAIAMARTGASTTWFSHHNHKYPVVEDLPEHWPTEYHNLVQRRLDLIASDKSVGLLEKPEHKRRWQIEPWEKREKEALRDWLLDRLEDRRFWFDGDGRPTPRSIAQLADEVARDPDLAGVLALWAGRPDAPVTATLVSLVSDQAVPFLAGYRYKPTGLRKREAWEHTWELQRAEDRGETLAEPIPVPPKYTSADFTKTSYWQHRGKLDVPKERFILYPDAGRDTDPSPLLGWAGWEHALQALALNVIIQQRESEGWPDEKLVPLAAGLAELQPWIDQWHTEVDPTYGVSLAAFCRELLAEHATRLGRTLDDLRAWRPAPARQGRRGRRPSAGA